MKTTPVFNFPQGTARKVQTPICKSDATVRKACLKVDAKRSIWRALKQRMRTGNKNADQTTQTFWFDITSMDNNSHVSYDVVRIHYMCVSNKHAWLSYILYGCGACTRTFVSCHHPPTSQMLAQDNVNNQMAHEVFNSHDTKVCWNQFNNAGC